MSRRISVSSLALMLTIAGTVLASAQVTSSQTNATSPIQTTSTSPVAYVYVSSMPISGTFHINAYAAASNGSLTTVSGSPYSANVQYMALNGRWLFGSNGIDIYSFSIASNGSLKQVSYINASQYNVYHNGGPISLFLDHTGSSLYDGDFGYDGTGNNGYQSFSINQTTGKLTYVSENGSSTEFGNPLSFASNNEYAYSSSCYHFDPLIYGFKRNADGALTESSITTPYPKAPSGDFYCPYAAAADPYMHLAVSVRAMSGFGSPASAYQLASYTITSTGNLTTSSTYSNMPKVAVGNVTNLAMAPGGKLLAVSGTSGLQVFHFNGANPVTHYTSLLTSNEVDQMFWDNANHLYAISRSAGKLYVFTVTPTSVSQAPGSPHSIAHPQNITVLPKT